MVYTNSDKSKLPNIQELVNMIDRHTRSMPVRHIMPFDHAVDGSDKFLLNRTASGLFTLKPNITNQACLFYGTPDIQRPLTPEFWHHESSMYKVMNVLREEFELVMESHPLYNLLKNGIETPRGIVRVINPYGISLAYGFPTALIPLTSSLEIAAFFATHRRNIETGQWEPVPEYDQNGERQYGTLYFMELAQPFPTILGLSTIGMQAFKRPAAQKLFGFNVPFGQDFNSHKFVTGFQFKQNPDSAAFLTKRFKSGEILTPDEPIARKAHEIRTTMVVSENAFKRNCRNNPADDFAKNRADMIAAGVRFVKEDNLLFTQEELERDYYLVAEQEWKAMCDEIIAVRPGFDKMLDRLKHVTVDDIRKGRV